MRHSRFVLPAAACLTLTAAAALAEGAFKPGLWEVTVTMSMPGLPFQPPPMTYTQCMTSKDAAPQSPAGGPAQRKCNVVDQKREGNKVSWKVKCDGGTEGSGEAVYSGDSFDGTTRLRMNNPRTGQAMDMTQTLHGVYKGECK